MPSDTTTASLSSSSSLSTLSNSPYENIHPNWDVPSAPVSMNDINDIFLNFEAKFGFQHDNVRNMYDHLLTMLDSRSARMSPLLALWTLHADYIGGEHANYRKWYFTAQLDLDDKFTPPKSPTGLLLEEAKREWREKMQSLSDHERFSHLALYLLIWGEAATLRYMPELLCFIFYVAECYRWNEEVVEDENDGVTPVTRTYFLDRVITPIYNFIRDQSYDVINGHYVRRERDHSSIIGYDDINQFFWDRRNIASLRLKSSEQQHQGEAHYLKDIPREERYLFLGDIDWNNTFKKTFYETRSWSHVLTNFSRVWIIHAASFWYYMAASVDFIYTNKHDDEEVDLPLRLSIIGLGGLVAIVLMALSTLTEFRYLNVSTMTAKILLKRLLILMLFASIHAGCTFYIVNFDRTSIIALTISSLQLGLGALLSILLVIFPSSRLFHRQKSNHQLSCQPFTANFPEMNNDDRFYSIMIWICVFSCKFLETYFFLALSFREALYVTVSMHVSNCSIDPLLGRWLCPVMPVLTTVLLFLVELILFFLDTYLWYVIWNTVFSVAQSMRIGISVMTSWKELFTKLPQNMFAKITSTNFRSLHMRRMACSQMWNAIVISMFRDHLLSEENLQRLLYQVQIKEAENGDKKRELHPPPIFDPAKPFNGDYFPKHSEAERRLSFFAQSLSTDFPSSCSVQTMPTFTVFTPHYAEKMVLSLREIIREEDSSTRVTLLEYLKRLHPTEWNNFVKDTKTIAEEQQVLLPTYEKHKKGEQEPSKAAIGGEKDDLPFYSVGFKSSAPEYTMRTRIWASLRTQTLYRTINGFMNYARALKILYRIENPNLGSTMTPAAPLTDENSGVTDTNNTNDGDPFINQKKDTSSTLDYIAHQKFRFLVAMQRYAKFSKEEAANCEFLLQEYPQLQVAYIDEEKDRVTNEIAYYSVLIDGHCETLPNDKRLPKYRIRLPGNPILGDGKSDNQNHALIFYRGEYLQLVDANQDNYLEECLKIRSIFGEFEQQEGSELSLGNVYALHTNAARLAKKKQDFKTDSPVAIVGAREYIFSENIGMLGDVAAGKEQTFGTLTQRIMAKTGGRLHYGHPDFLNAVFMTTRGGVSKAQRALHLNEDIYAGMNALLRGGRIKHTEYLQCGKGRDLGFCSILNFTTKIGTGTGEQMLSREYYYLGTQLPLDRFLTFYYAHPGFHINNIMIIFAIQMFLFCMAFVGTMSIALPHCQGDDCFDVRPVNDWLQRCVLSIFMVFFIAFLPLFLQELTEKGTKRSILRLVKQFVSLSPLFEVFVTQIYANSVLSNLSFGGARYIATGRGFATSRIPFSVLYSRFAHPSIYFGARTMFILIFVSLALGLPHLIYFWATVASLMISPFVFNPHQFVFRDFMNDYREFLGWLARGNSTRYHEHSWITFCRQGRTLVTGIKKKAGQQSFGANEKPNLNAIPRAHLSSIFFTEIWMPFVQASLFVFCYAFYKSREQVDTYGTLLSPFNTSLGPIGALGRILFISIAPISFNAVVLISVQIFSLLSSRFKRTGYYMALIAHAGAIFGFIVVYEILWTLENFQVCSTLLGLLSMFAVQRAFFKVIVGLFLTREVHDDATNRAWWSGNWKNKHLTSLAPREYVCKIVEMSLFTIDFILGHLILFALFPFTLIPSGDRFHSLILFWLKPSKQIRPSILSTNVRRRRLRIAYKYGTLFVLVLLLFTALIVLPPMLTPKLPAIFYQVLFKTI
ncbi:1,3-beta-glucan synthase component-domain-containing protein [Mycotypha africana]|uniref:1,3-beta-glucan synthase component-domain-containing protein n=1 Tax=Mycotypha africana TaxID=64632 RepID=UPI0023001B4A|nr:1,3-beta-glucan synthase component-domain-containing protein [Mycotypha africana]KAI8973193.1 1,3-beta-glucan synthase component-domain-containing protein [Mycotypha africana]